MFVQSVAASGTLFWRKQKDKKQVSLLLMPKVWSMIMAITSPADCPCWDHFSADNAEDEPWCEKALGECHTVAETQERGCQKGGQLWFHPESPDLEGCNF